MWIGGQKVLRAKRANFIVRYPLHFFLVPSTCPLHKLGNITYSVKQRRKTQFESGWGTKSFARESSRNFLRYPPLFFLVNYISPLHNLGDITYIALSKGAKHSLKLGGGVKSFASEASKFFFEISPSFFPCPLHKLGNRTYSAKQRRKTQFESGWG